MSRCAGTFVTNFVEWLVLVGGEVSCTCSLFVDSIRFIIYFYLFLAVISVGYLLLIIIDVAQVAHMICALIAVEIFKKQLQITIKNLKQSKQKLLIEIY